MSDTCILCHHAKHSERCRDCAPNPQFTCACAGPCEHNRDPLYCSICKELAALRERAETAEARAEQYLVELRETRTILNGQIGTLTQERNGSHKAFNEVHRNLVIRTQERNTLGQQLEHDRTLVADCIMKANRAIDSRHWLTEGRGPYEWSDDRWHEEFYAAAREIKAAIEPLTKIAADWSGCPMSAEAVAKARVDIVKERDTLAAQVAVMREAIELIPWDLMKSAGSPYRVAISEKAFDQIYTAISTLSSDAGSALLAELRELREDKARLLSELGADPEIWEGLKKERAAIDAARRKE